jgi:hypothetical protein
MTFMNGLSALGRLDFEMSRPKCGSEPIMSMVNDSLRRNER